MPVIAARGDARAERPGGASPAPPDATGRRVRLLAVVDAGFRPEHARRDGPAWDVATGDQRWFADNIPCQRACPAHTDVPGYLALIADGRYDDAYALNREHNVFPGCLGRICARPCEAACRRQVVDAPVSICNLKRVAADYRLPDRRPRRPAANGRTVGIVGAGVAGLSAARDLARDGYGVTIYERLRVPGGMLWAGVPAWRLPRAVVWDEVGAVAGLGVEIRYGVDVGRDVLLEDLVARHDAVLVAAGCQLSQRLGIPGEELDGVVGGLEFLQAVNLGEPGRVPVGRRVLVVGGGFTSLDCVRTAVRLGAEAVTLVYRRSREEIPVEPDELREATDEGVALAFTASPVRILGEGGRVTGVALVRNALGAPDASGRSRPEPVPGSETVVPCDQVVVAIGQRQTLDLDPTGFLPDLDRRGVPRADDDLRTAHGKVWVAGDYFGDPRNFISAIADGRRAAASIDRALRGTPPARRVLELTPVGKDGGRAARALAGEGAADWTLTAMARRLRWGDPYTQIPRQATARLPVPARVDAVDREVDLVYPERIVREQASRCLQCQLNIVIDGSQCILCNGCVEACPQGSIAMVALDRLASIDGDQDLPRAAERAYGSSGAAMLIDEEACIRCGVCVDRCPTGCLTMQHYRGVDAPARP